MKIRVSEHNPANIISHMFDLEKLFPGYPLLEDASEESSMYAVVLMQLLSYFIKVSQILGKVFFLIYISVLLLSLAYFKFDNMLFEIFCHNTFHG